MAPATRTSKRPSNATEAPPPSPSKSSTTTSGTSRAPHKAAAQKRGGGGEGRESGDEEERRENKSAFVTVGTTRFDALVRAVDCPAFEAALLSRGFTRLVVQAGAGGHAPERLLGPDKEGKRGGSSSSRKGSSPAASATATARFSGTTAKGLSVEFFDYAPSLRDRFAGADLVVTHAGAGSIFETLSTPRPPASASASGARKGRRAPSPAPGPIPLIAVPNGALMHNHQAELASELEARGLLVSATPETLARVLTSADFSRLRRYEAGGVQGVVAAIDELSGRRGSKKARKG
jgi:beta-1,4-N-acetylglucosaminyltransferase